jgi:integrase
MKGNYVMAEWTADQLATIEENDDLFVAPFREDGTTYGTPTQTWALVVDPDREHRRTPPRRWFRHHIWTSATAAAQLAHTVRFHDLRHAHASWLLAGGADIETVKERLGHGSLRTTEKYLHTLPDTDNTALDALQRTRNRTSR